VENKGNVAHASIKYSMYLKNNTPSNQPNPFSWLFMIIAMSSNNCAQCCPKLFSCSSLEIRKKEKRELRPCEFWPKEGKKRWNEMRDFPHVSFSHSSPLLAYLVEFRFAAE